MWEKLLGAAISAGRDASNAPTVVSPSLGPVTVGGLNAPAYPFDGVPGQGGAAAASMFGGLDSRLVLAAVGIGLALILRKKG